MFTVLNRKLFGHQEIPVYNYFGFNSLDQCMNIHKQ